MAMLRTLRAIGILALSVAGLLAVFCVADGLREDLCRAPIGTLSAVDEFIEKRHNGQDSSSERMSPLVQQAQAFALYLAPPPKPGPTPLPAEAKVAPVPEVKPVASSPQFQLQGISYHRSQPETSMALVWQPDTGRRWVRQGTQLGHLVIEQINSEAIVYRDGQLTHELALKPDATPTAMAQQDKGRVSPAKPGERPPSALPATGPQGVESPAVKVAQNIGGTLSSSKPGGPPPAAAMPTSAPSTHPSSSKSVMRAVAAERRRWARVPYGESVTEQDKHSR